MTSSRRVLVTGGAGFIGSHIVDLLVADGLQVGILDSMVNGKNANINQNTTFFRGDVCDPGLVDRVFDEFRPHMVNHQAGHVSVVESLQAPVADATTNVLGSLVVLDACKRYEIEHMTFASTGGALYGSPGIEPIQETSLVAPMSPYGASKRAVEGYLEMYRETWGLSSAALRYANVYGPRQSYDGEAGVVAIFARIMLDNGTPVIFGSGHQTRDFIEVADVAEANLAVMKRGLEGAYNVGTGIATSVADIATRIALECEFKGTLRYEDARPGEIEHIVLDSGLLTRDSAWEAKIAIGEGIAMTVDHFRGDVR